MKLQKMHNQWTLRHEWWKTVGERFGHFQDVECHAMKSRFVSIGDSGIGRVPFAYIFITSIDDNTLEFQKAKPTWGNFVHWMTQIHRTQVSSFPITSKWHCLWESLFNGAIDKLLPKLRSLSTLMPTASWRSLPRIKWQKWWIVSLSRTRRAVLMKRI